MSFVIIVYSFSTRNRYSKNGFIRLLPSHKIIGIISKDLEQNSWRLSGAHDSSIFLNNMILPSRLLSVDSSLKNKIILSLSGLENMTLYKGTSIIIDSLSMYLLDGMKPIILKGTLSDRYFKQKIGTPYFSSAIPLSKTSVALRYVNMRGGNVLAKLPVGSDSLRSTHLLEKQVDGLFCTDGEMVKIPGSSKMIYVYYYRNQFLCADSNLNLLYKGKTIDTISKAKIKVAKITSTGETTMSAPPLYVNKRACANSKYLFVQSALRANNETEYMIKNVSIIDVYAISDGKYQFSFYLPDFRGFKVRDFKVYGKSLYALYDHYLYKYQLNF